MSHGDIRIIWYVILTHGHIKKSNQKWISWQNNWDCLKQSTFTLHPNSYIFSPKINFLNVLEASQKPQVSAFTFCSHVPQEKNLVTSS